MQHEPEGRPQAWVSLAPPAPEEARTFGQGSLVGPYEVLGLVAAGGMAAVYLARRPEEPRRLLALKRIHPHLCRDDNFAKMFVDEARVAGRIQHPNVVPTLGLEDPGDAGVPCIVMEYVDGDQLRRFMQHPGTADGRIPARVALRVLCDLLDGLHAAHELTGDDGAPLEVVHRDVSPQNVLLGRDGVTQVTDFGIARSRGRLAVTRGGLVRGKLRYMAPEQARASQRAPDRRADVFAAGIIAWEVLTGRRLFRGDEETVLKKLLHLPIPALREVRASIDEHLDLAVLGALERDPDARHATAREFREALERAAARGDGVADRGEVAAFVEAVLGPREERPSLHPDLDAGPATDVEVLFSEGALQRASEAPVVHNSWPAPPRPSLRPRPVLELVPDPEPTPAPAAPEEVPESSTQVPVIPRVFARDRRSSRRALAYGALATTALLVLMSLVVLLPRYFGGGVRGP